MNNEYNLHNLQALFHDFLITENVSRVSIKNYISDIKYYLSWFGYQAAPVIEYRNSTLSVPVNLVDLFIESSSFELVERYLEYLKNNETPYRTINRRLSSLRKFYAFACSRGIVQLNPSLQIRNISSADAEVELNTENKAESAIASSAQLEDIKQEWESFISCNPSLTLPDNALADVEEFFGYIDDINADTEVHTLNIMNFKA